jgi:hypothetical protein
MISKTVMVGIVMIAIGLPTSIIGLVENQRTIEIVEQREAQYMQEHYGYEDNMEDYLDYLKNHDIDAYMKLKPIYERLQIENNYIHLGMFGIVSVFVGFLIWKSQI